MKFCEECDKAATYRHFEDDLGEVAMYSCDEHKCRLCEVIDGTWR